MNNNTIRRIDMDTPPHCPIAIYTIGLHKRFKQLVTLAKQEKGYSVNKIAEWAGIDRTSLRSLIDTDAKGPKEPSLRTVLHLCMFMGLEIDDVLMMDKFITNHKFGVDYDKEYSFTQPIRGYMIGANYNSVWRDYGHLIEIGSRDKLTYLSDFKVDFGRRLNERLRECCDGNRVTELADALILPHNTIKNYLYGRRLPSPSGLVNLARALGTTPSKLIMTETYIIPDKRKFTDYYSVSRGLKNLEEATEMIDVFDPRWKELMKGTGDTL